MWSKLPTIYRGAIIIAIPAISILPAIATWSWSRHAKNEAQWRISHSEEIIREASLLMKVLVDAETGIRGYAIAREANFLEPYQTAESEIPISLNSLEELVAEDSQQQARLRQTEQQIEQRLDLLAEVLERIETQPDDLSGITQPFAEGRTQMSLIRLSLDRFEDEEWQSLKIYQQRLATINRNSDLALGISIASILLGYGLAIKLYLQSERELEHQAQKLLDTNEDLVAVNQLLETRNQELDEFAYIVSHDLKAPLRAIDNLSQWIEEDLEDKLDADTRQNMSLLRSRVQRMNNFIDGLLEYSRAGENREKTTVDVGLMLREILDAIAPPPNFKIEIGENMPVLSTEALPLQQVFSNLISNAIKHHPRNDGKITISAIEQGKYYQFAIADDGTGIALEYQSKIFAIFQTLTSKDRKENTGIGLSIVKKIVEDRGGKIWLKSELGHGSTFYFTWSRN